MQVELKSSDKFTQSENKNEQVKKILTTITFLKLSRRFSPHTKSFEVYKINLLCQSGGSQSAGSLIYPDPGPNFCPTRIRIQTLLGGLKYLRGKMGQLNSKWRDGYQCKSTSEKGTFSLQSKYSIWIFHPSPGSSFESPVCIIGSESERLGSDTLNGYLQKPLKIKVKPRLLKKQATWYLLKNSPQSLRHKPAVNIITGMKFDKLTEYYTFTQFKSGNINQSLKYLVNLCINIISLTANHTVKEWEAFFTRVTRGTSPIGQPESAVVRSLLWLVSRS